MELRHLRYFVAVAEELNFTHTAARLHVAQPALSSQIKDLEQELEVRLFERGHTGVQLTRAGKAFLPRARAILAQAAQAVDEARKAGGSISGTLALGYPSGLHLNYVLPAIQAFGRAHPKVAFDYFHGTNKPQLKALREGRIDVGFINLPAPLDKLESEVIWRIPFKVVLPRRHPLARRAEFELADLSGEDFVFCTRESRQEFYDEFFRQCSNAGFRPRVVKEVGGYPTNMLGLIAAGVGVGILPHFEKAERIEGIVWRPLTRPKLWIDWALVWRPGPNAVLAEQFVTTATHLFKAPQETAASEY